MISRCQRVATMARLSPDASTAAAPGLPVPLTQLYHGDAGARATVRNLPAPGSDARACPAWWSGNAGQRGDGEAERDQGGSVHAAIG